MTGDSERPQAIERKPEPTSTPGEGTSQRECAKPVAWLAFAADGSESSSVYMTDGEARAAADEWNWCIAPLYRSPTLTDAERRAITRAVAVADEFHDTRLAATLRGLLERTR
jgi:hypothetical protein